MCWGEAIGCAGETPQSLRVGLFNTLDILGCSPGEIVQYLGCRSSDTARHFTCVSHAASALNLLESVMLRVPSVTDTVSHP